MAKKRKPLTRKEQAEQAFIRGLFLLCVLLCSPVNAEDMIFVSYVEVPDCKYPSAKICVPDEHEVKHCVILLNSMCR